MNAEQILEALQQHVHFRREALPQCGRARNPASILGLQIPYYSPFTGRAEPRP